MVGLPRSIIKKYGVSKKAWAVFRGSKGTRKKKSGGSMAKKKYSKKRGLLGGGMMSIFKSIAIGTAAGIVAPRIPVLNTMPYNGAIAGGAAVFLLGQKKPVNVLTGAASGQFVAPVAGNMLNQVTGMRIY